MNDNKIRNFQGNGIIAVTNLDLGKRILNIRIIDKEEQVGTKSPNNNISIQRYNSRP